MRKSPATLVGIVIVLLVLAGLAYYFLSAQYAVAPTATSTPSGQQATTSTSTAPAADMKTYTDAGKTFSFTYPAEFSVTSGSAQATQGWRVDAPSDGQLLATLTIPGSYMPKTNFGDARFTVGMSTHPDAVAQCLAAPASGGSVEKSVVTINGTTYTKYVWTDAGAGNRYQTTSYRTIHDGKCYAMEYTIHYSVLENYSPDQGITQYDQQKIYNVLNGIAQSFTFLS